MEDIQAPQEVKDEISKRLTENGVIDRLEKNVYEALNGAAKEISSHPELPSQYIHSPFEKSDEKELMALSAVYQFLKSRGLDYTYKCLLEESNSKETNKYGELDINKVLAALMEDDDEDVQVVGGNQEKNNSQEVEEKHSSSNSSSSDVEDVKNNAEHIAAVSDSDSEPQLSIDESSSDAGFIDIDDENEDDDVPAKKQEEKKPEKDEKIVEQATSAFLHNEVAHHVTPPETISKAKFEINDIIFKISDL